jgi:hypothetical protein
MSKARIFPAGSSAKIRWAGKSCAADFPRYNNGRIGIILLHKGEDWAVASVNLVAERMEDDEVAIKDYSENEGMLDALIAAGVVQAPHRFADSGYVRIPICRLA